MTSDERDQFAEGLADDSAEQQAESSLVDSFADQFAVSDPSRNRGTIITIAAVVCMCAVAAIAFWVRSREVANNCRGGGSNPPNGGPTHVRGGRNISDELAGPGTLADAWWRFYEAAKHHQRAEFQQAYDLLRRVHFEALDLAGEPRRICFESAYLAGQHLELMHEWPDRSLAYQNFADRMVLHRRWQQLDQLNMEFRRLNTKSPLIDYYYGRFFEAIGSRKSAILHFRKGFTTAIGDEKSIYRREIIRLASQETPAKRLYYELGADEDTFVAIAERVDDLDRIVELQTLLLTHSEKYPNSPNLAYYNVRVLFLLENYKAALQRIKTAINSSKPSARMLALRRQCRFLHLGAVETWKLANDKSAEFRWLADRLIAGKRFKELDDLIAAHASVAADDLLVHEVTTEGALANGNWERAIEVARVFHGKAKTGRARELLIRAWAMSGDPFRAFALPEKEKTCESLARVFLETGNTKSLVRLIADHKDAFENELHQQLWESAIPWIDKEYKTVIRLLERNDGRLLNDPRYAREARDRLVRAYLHIAKPADAEKAYRQYRGSGDLMLETAIAAARGDVQAVQIGIYRMLSKGISVAALYADNNLGPALRGKSMEAVRLQFPQPEHA